MGWNPQIPLIRRRKISGGNRGPVSSIFVAVVFDRHVFPVAPNRPWLFAIARAGRNEIPSELDANVCMGWNPQVPIEARVG
jgi:hypothetical protein